MTTSNTNKSTTVEYQVLTCKSQTQIFQKVEEFRSTNRLETRNASLNILIAAGLWAFGKLNEEGCIEILNSNGLVEKPIQMTHKNPESEGEM